MGVWTEWPWRQEWKQCTTKQHELPLIKAERATTDPGYSNRMQERPVLLLQRGSPLHHQFHGKFTASDLLALKGTEITLIRITTYFSQGLPLLPARHLPTPPLEGPLRPSDVCCGRTSVSPCVCASCTSFAETWPFAWCNVSGKLGQG